MSKETVKEFFVKLEEDKELQEKFKSEIKDVNQESEEAVGGKIVGIAKEAGFEFSMDDLLSARKDLLDQVNENTELDDSSLKAVAGGMTKGESTGLSIFTIGIGCAVASIVGEVKHAEGQGSCKQEMSYTHCNE